MNSYKTSVVTTYQPSTGHRLVRAMRLLVVILVLSAALAIALNAIWEGPLPLWLNIILKSSSESIRLVFIAYCFYLLRTRLQVFALFVCLIDIASIPLTIAVDPQPLWREAVRTTSFIIFAVVAITLPVKTPKCIRRLRLGGALWVATLLGVMVVRLLQESIPREPVLYFSMGILGLISGLTGVTFLGWTFLRIAPEDFSVPTRPNGA